jgi:hypothetical protein
MKLAEALINRADTQKRIQQLRERLNRCAKVQEGETTPENPQELMEELARVVSQLTALVKQINKTNAATAFADGMTLTDALAERDALALERNVLADLIENAAGQQRGYPYVASQIKYFRSISVADVQKRVDDLARRYRELDSRIQELNWQVDLME